MMRSNEVGFLPVVENGRLVELSPKQYLRRIIELLV